MVVKRQCSFCAAEIEPGTGSMFVKRDGTVFHFCTSSCRKQQLHLGRVGHRFKWTRAHALKVAADRAGSAKSAAASASARGGGRPAGGQRKSPPKAAAVPASDTPVEAAPPTTGAPPAGEAKPAPRPRARKKSTTPAKA